MRVQTGLGVGGHHRELLGLRGLSCSPVSMMHQQAASSHYSAAQGGSQHYQGQSMAMMGQSGQGGGVMGQRPMAPYRPSQQGEAALGTGNRWGRAAVGSPAPGGWTCRAPCPLGGPVWEVLGLGEVTSALSPQARPSSTWVRRSTTAASSTATARPPQSP